MTVTKGNSTVSVLLNDGDGTFSTVTHYPTAAQAADIDVGDFNGDTYLDIVSTHRGVGTLRVLLNEGDGTFADSVPYTVAGNANQSIVTDVNLDEYLDIASVGNTNPDVTISLGNGNGTFAAATSYEVGEEPWMLLTADFNLDGYPDFATQSYSEPGGVFVLLNDGDGTFGDAIGLSTTVWVTWLTTGNYNNDDLPDLAAIHEDVSELHVLLNTTPLPTIAFTTNTGGGEESVASPTIELTLSAANDINVTVAYEVTGGSATGGGADYTLASGTATIVQGETTGTVPLSIENDTDIEENETVIITISSPTNALLGVITSFTYTITDNDTPPPPPPSGGGGTGLATPPPTLAPPPPTPPPPPPPAPTQGLQYPGLQIPQLPTAPAAPVVQNPVFPMQSLRFPRDLGFGSTGKDVQELQILLNTRGFIITPRGPGAPGQETEFYGLLTKAGVKLLQERYKGEILTPLELNQGTGFFGPYTRAFIHKMGW